MMKPALLLLLCAIPAPAFAACGESALVQICAMDIGALSPGRKVIRMAPRTAAFAAGDAFPVADHSVLMDPTRFGLPPVDGPWRYYALGGEIYRIDARDGTVIDLVTGGNRALLR